MSVLDIWAILTGLASVVSLLLYLSEKYSHWRKYTVPTGWATAGFAIGRISGMFTPQVFQSFQDTRLLGMLLITFIVFVATFAFVIIQNRAGKHLDSQFVIFLAFCYLPTFLIVYRNADVPLAIPMSDYLHLAKVKEERGDLAEAIRYLELYASKVETQATKTQIDTKTATLAKEQIQMDLQAIKTK